MRLPIPQKEPNGRINVVFTLETTLVDIKINFNAFTAKHTLQCEHLPLRQLIYDRLKLPSLAFNK